MTEPEPKAPPRRFIERALSVFAEVRAGEATTALLLTLAIFFLLAAYYVIKPVRDSLITGLPNGAQYKSYMGGAIAIALLVAVPAYGRFAANVARSKLLLGVGAFFVSNLVLFYVLGGSGAVTGETGQLVFALGFFLWVGIFNMMMVAQFWAFAADVYTEEQGKRLFALIAIGQSVGSALGSSVSTFAKQLGTNNLLLVGAALLGLSTALTLSVSVRETGVAPPPRARKEPEKEIDKSDGDGPFAMVLKDRYLLLIAAFSVVFTLVNTNGEYVKDELIAKLARETGAAEGLTAAQIGDLRTSLIGGFYTAVNIAGVLLQSFGVSRLVKHLGLRRAFLILPAVAMLDAAAIAVIPIWSVVRFTKIAENSTDYSLNNTLRGMLWLPTSRRAKYLAKQAVDSFAVRLGDVSSSLFVLLLAGVAHLSVRSFGIANIALVLVWLWLARAIGREHEARVARREAEAAASS